MDVTNDGSAGEEPGGMAPPDGDAGQPPGWLSPGRLRAIGALVVGLGAAVVMNALLLGLDDDPEPPVPDVPATTAPTSAPTTAPTTTPTTAPETTATSPAL